MEILSFKSCEILENLLKKLCEYGPRTGDGDQAIHLAAARGHVDVVLSIFNHELENARARIDARGNLDRTPLHYAALECQVLVRA